MTVDVALIGHYRVVFCLSFKMSLCTKPFIWKCVPPQVHFHPNSLSHESFAQRLVLKQTYKVTGKWLNLSINLMVPWKSYAHNIWTSQPHNLFNFVAPNPPTASVKCYLTVQMWNVISIDAFKNQESSFEAGVSTLDSSDTRRIFKEMVYLLKHDDSNEQ